MALVEDNYVITLPFHNGISSARLIPIMQVTLTGSVWLSFLLCFVSKTWKCHSLYHVNSKSYPMVPDTLRPSFKTVCVKNIQPNGDDPKSWWPLRSPLQQN